MESLYREATSEELQFYQQTVYPLQDNVFETAAIYGDKLYLTGGTALSRFYFHHRLSEDLDFFTTTDDLKWIANDLRLRLRDKGFSVEVDRLEVYFARMYVVTQDCRLKIEFAKEFHLFDPLARTEKNIFVNSLQDLGANKVTAFEDRANIKDIIDLYYITQRIPLERLFEIAETKRVPVAYEDLLTINLSGISGNVLVTTHLAESDLADFVDELRLKTEIEIKKKEKIARDNIQQIAAKLLWDFPHERRRIDEHSLPVLRRRATQLKLPEQIALQKAL